MFLDILNNMNLSPVVQETGFKVILPKGYYKFDDLFKRIVASNNSLKIWIDGDCDPDGYLSARQIQITLEALGHTNYFITKHLYKRHVINSFYFNNVLKKEHPDIVIVLDSSSNSPDIIDICVENDIELLVIDHHDSNVNRALLPDNITIINPVMDSNEEKSVSPLNDLSCGAICSLLIETLMQLTFPQHYYKLNGEHYVCGYITLYSDSCPFSLYNIAYAKMVRDRRYPLPDYVECMTNKYTTFAKYFVTMTFVPKINAMIREEKFDMVYDYIFNFDKFISNYSVEDIIDIHNKSREYVTQLKNSCTFEDHKSFIVAKLKNEVRAGNYTGLVAQRFISDYGKPCLCIIEANNIYQGSVRAPYDIDLLSKFKYICKAGGHPPAFGIEIVKSEYDRVIYTIKSLISEIDFSNPISRDVIFFDVDRFASNDRELLNDLKLIGIYNEFSGKGVPPAYITLTLTHNHRIYRNENYTRINWGSIKITCFKGYPERGDKLIIYPRYSVSELPDLIVENIVMEGNYV